MLSSCYIQFTVARCGLQGDPGYESWHIKTQSHENNGSCEADSMRDDSQQDSASFASLLGP
jgi:hypothetical protein